MAKTYTIEEIKKAFWEKFHESGELWFPGWSNEREGNELATKAHWMEFVQELDQKDEVNDATEEV